MYLFCSDVVYSHSSAEIQVLKWSINKNFLSKQSSIKHLFTSFAFAMKRSFRFMMFEMATSCLSVFKLDATSSIDFAIKSGDRSESRSFVPIERTKWSGFSLFRNFPSLDVFDHAVSKYHDFLTFILIFFTVIFCSYHSRGAFIFFSVSLLCLSILLLAFELNLASTLDFSLVFAFLLSLRIALPSGFEFTRSRFTGGSSALTAIVLLER